MTKATKHTMETIQQGRTLPRRRRSLRRFISSSGLEITRESGSRNGGRWLAGSPVRLALSRNGSVKVVLAAGNLVPIRLCYTGRIIPAQDLMPTKGQAPVPLPPSSCLHSNPQDSLQAGCVSLQARCRDSLPNSSDPALGRTLIERIAKCQL